MKKFIVYLMSLCIICTALCAPVTMFAEAIGSFGSNELAVLPDVKSQYEKYELGCNVEEMLYGTPTASFDGRTYGFSSGRLFSIDSNKKNDPKLVLDINGSNINQFGSTIFFSSQKNNTAQINTYDLKTKQFRQILNNEFSGIDYLYVVNNEEIFFLADGNVYRCDILGHDMAKVNTVENVISFVPTDSGIIYEAKLNGKLSIFLDDILIVDSETYYCIEEDHFVATVDGQLLQIPMSQLRGAISSDKVKKSKEIDITPYMTSFNLYGVYDACEILGTDDDDRECDYCENGGECVESNTFTFDSRINEKRDAAVDEVIETATIDVSQTMIIDQAKLMKNCKWTPVKTFESYPSGTVKTFTAGIQQTGIPYARSKHFKGTEYDSDWKIVFNKTSNTIDSSRYISITCFKNQIANSNSLIYAAYEDLPDAGPLYGCDCGTFVSFCWKIKRTTSGLYSTSEDCTQLSRNVSVLQVGDALVKYDFTTKSGHCVLIKAVGSSSVTIWEQTPPQVSESVYSNSDIKTEYLDKGYIPYRLNTCKITLNKNGGDSLAISTVYVAKGFKYNTDVNLPTPIRTGYTFLGWYDGNNNKITSSHASDEDETFYAHWMLDNVADNNPALIPKSCQLRNKKDHYTFN